MTTIGLDITVAQRAHPSGAERQLRGLYGALKRELMGSDAGEQFELVGLGWDGATRSASWDAARTLAWTAFGARLAAATARVDLLHVFGRPVRRARATTIWSVGDDFSLGGHAQWSSRTSQAWGVVGRRLAKNADALVAVSSAVADDLESFGVDRDRIHVITPGRTELPPATPFSGPVQRRDGTTSVPSSYLLAVNALQRRRDPLTIAHAAELAGVAVVFVGMSHLGEGELDQLMEISSVHLAGEVTDGELNWLIQNATAVVSASRYEGLDLPVAEALAQATPVVVSDIPVHLDLIGGLGHLFSVGSIEEAAAAIRTAQAAEPFSPRHVLPRWDEVARQHLDLYAHYS